MRAFVVRFSFSTPPNQEIGSGGNMKHLRNDLFCVKWDVKSQITQSVKCTPVGLVSVVSIRLRVMSMLAVFRFLS